MIVQTITDEYHFWNWLKHSDSYNTKFSLEGAKAVQAYFDDLSESSSGGTIDFDPIAWCVEFSEYDSLAQAYREYNGLPNNKPTGNTKKQMLEYFQDNTTVIELDNGHVIIGEF